MSPAPVAALALAVLLAACSDPEPATAPAASTPPPGEASPASEQTAPAPAERPSRLGAGTPLTGSVSGLSGQVTAFQVEVTATATIVRLAADVLFAFDSADLGPGAPEQLRRTADLIALGGQGPVVVVGHTDAQGTDVYNDDLSLRRAEAVARWLSTEAGVPPDRLRAEGRGEREPVEVNTAPDGRDDPAGRARNRRVVVTIPAA